MRHRVHGTTRLRTFPLPPVLAAKTQALRCCITSFHGAHFLLWVVFVAVAAASRRCCAFNRERVDRRVHGYPPSSDPPDPGSDTQGAHRQPRKAAHPKNVYAKQHVHHFCIALLHTSRCFTWPTCAMLHAHTPGLCLVLAFLMRASPLCLSVSRVRNAPSDGSRYRLRIAKWRWGRDELFCCFFWWFAM